MGECRLAPSGKRGFILGLILGRNAGDRTTPLLLTLPRFLFPLPPLFSILRSLSSAPGVETATGEPTNDGLGTAEAGRAEDGVIWVPDVGVSRADRRGVVSVEVEEASCVFICVSEGFREDVSAAAGN